MPHYPPSGQIQGYLIAIELKLRPGGGGALKSVIIVTIEGCGFSASWWRSQPKLMMLDFTGIEHEESSFVCIVRIVM